MVHSPPSPRPVNRSRVASSWNATSGRPQTLAGRVQGITETLQAMVRIRLARVSLGLRRGLLWIAVTTLAALAVCVWVAACMWFVVISLVHGGRALLPDAPWLGGLLVAFLGILGLSGLLYGAFAMVGRSALRKLGDTGPPPSTAEQGTVPQ